METKHTPGPWQLERLTGDHDIGIRVTGPVVSGYTAFIRTGWPHENQRVEQEANAKLIAAAPDLLEALMTLVSSYDAEDSFAELTVARAAIAKATGSAA